MKAGLFVVLAAAAHALGQVRDVKQGTPLAVAMSPAMRQMVSVQAVMLPYAMNRELFSKHIADNYAVVVVNVGNRSHDAALVMQGIYLDYSKWALSGSVARSDDWSDHSAGALSGQVSSVEYRIVRGELEERDAKTVRNWILRSLELGASIAGGTTFVYGAMTNIPKYISMASGVGVPGFEKLWPDALTSRLNRISDFGYRVNRVVPRESSDVMIAFFPIDRFLTPQLKKIFVKRPALFFNTGLALIDPNPQMTELLERVSGQTLKALTAQIPALIACSAEHGQEACDHSASLRRLIKSTSLNSIELMIEGNIMLEVSAVPPIVDSVTLSQDENYWSVPGPGKSIVINGRFLEAARVAIEPSDLAIDWVSADVSSNSVKLAGQLRFNRPIPAGQALAIKVVKDAKGGQALVSASVPYTVSTAK